MIVTALTFAGGFVLGVVCTFVFLYCLAIVTEDQMDDREDFANGY